MTQQRDSDGARPRVSKPVGQRLVEAGLLTRPEALSLVTLENAVKVLLRDGLLDEVEGGGLRADRAACAALEARLIPMVGR